MNTEKVDLSIVTPCFNEEASIQYCLESVSKVMYEKLPNLTYEHIIVDNCSQDSTYKKIQELSKLYPNVRAFRNSRNVGALNNIYQGLTKCNGDAVIPMLPADLQDPVELIPELYAKYQLGYLVVFGERRKREENFFVALLRRTYYRILRKLASSNIPIDSGEFLLADRRVISSILLNQPEDPYLRGLIAQSTDLVTTIPYTWAKRMNGESKTSLSAMIDVGLSGLVATSRVPARIAVFGGLITSLFGFLGSIWVITNKVFLNSAAADGITSVIVVTMLVGGIQLFFLGIIGEYVLSIHGQVKPKPKVFDISGEYK